MSFLKVPNKNYNEIEDNDISLAEAAIDILMEDGTYTIDQLKAMGMKLQRRMEQFHNSFGQFPELAKIVAGPFQKYDSEFENVKTPSEIASICKKLRAELNRIEPKVKEILASNPNGARIVQGLKRLAAETVVVLRATSHLSPADFERFKKEVEQ